MTARHRFWAYLSPFVLMAGVCLAQDQAPATTPATESTQPAAESAQPADESASPAAESASPAAPPANPTRPALRQQPKRILGIMPNYRAVSAGAIAPPPTAKQALKIATQNSFDSSSFLFVGVTSLMAWGVEWPHAKPSHPALGSGLIGYSRYYWRGFLDKTDGNYLVIFALPTILHEDERYYAKGEGGALKRTIYAASRILITPDYHGHSTFNAAEVFGRGMAQGISASYYPSADRTLGALAVKYGYAMSRDALTNVFREFWPDISAHVLHRHHSSENTP